MKIKVQRHSILGIAMALFVVALMSYQSAHRYFEHHDTEEVEHEECGLCDWHFAPIETSSFCFFSPVVFIPEMVHLTAATAGLIEYKHNFFDGRGPPLT